MAPTGTAGTEPAGNGSRRVTGAGAGLEPGAGGGGGGAPRRGRQQRAGAGLSTCRCYGSGPGRGLAVQRRRGALCGFPSAVIGGGCGCVPSCEGAASSPSTGLLVFACGWAAVRLPASVTRSASLQYQPRPQAGPAVKRVAPDASAVLQQPPAAPG